MKKINLLLGVLVLIISLFSSIALAEENTKPYIGKKVWVNKYWEGLFENTGLTNLEPVTITKIEWLPSTEIAPAPEYQFAFDNSTYVVTVKKANGKLSNVGNREVRIKSLSELNTYFYFSDPFNGKKWTKQAIDAIKAQKVFIGMGKDQVILSWGQPDDVNKTITGKNTYEQWVYNKGNYKYSYLYFENGKLTTIQN